MSVLDALRIAFWSQLAHKLRWLLTLLGVVIGVTTIIAVLTIINGLNNYVSQRVSLLGRDSFLVDKEGVVTNLNDLIEARKRKDLTFADVEAIRANCRSCDMVGAARNRFVTVKYGREYIKDSFVRAHTYETPRILNIEIESGRMIAENDVGHSRSVVVIGYDVADNLFPQLDPLGHIVKVDGFPYEVIGVAKRVGTAFGRSQDNFVILPISAFVKRYGSQSSITILAKASRPEMLEQAKSEVRAILRARQHTRYDKDDGFAIQDSQTFIGLWQNLTGVFFVVTIAISSISLVVGGIVIMNIMLVSVKERTLEIGIRKAVGARRRDVLRQFLVESVLVSISGGLLGILAGYGIAALLGPLIGAPAEVTAFSIALGVGMSASVGLFFGIYPAWKAAGLDPIVALRYEQ